MLNARLGGRAALRFAAVCALVLLALQGSAAQRLNGTQLFDAVGEILEQKYINPRSADVPSVVARFRVELRRVCPQPSACSIIQGRVVVQNMLDSFDDAHLALYNDLYVQRSLVGDPNVSGRFGMFLDGEGNGLSVTDVYPESPANRAGIAVGDRVVSVQGKSGTPSALQRSLRQAELAFTETSIGLVRDGQPRSVTLRATFNRTLEPQLDQVRRDTMRIRIYELGQFYIDQLTHRLVEQVNTAGAKNLILDLRYNEGGTSVASMKIAAAFTDPPQRALVDKAGGKYLYRYVNGEVEWRNASDEFQRGVFEGKVERPSLFKGKLIVLTSRRTYSAGEHLAYILQQTKRAVVIGQATAGGLDSSATTTKLNEGEDLLYYGDRRYEQLNGTRFPSRVIPDISASATAQASSTIKDNVIEAALKQFDAMP
jgi:carboxyl-terminal processing protease